MKCSGFDLQDQERKREGRRKGEKERGRKNEGRKEGTNEEINPLE